jgi:hypothetical protein
MQKSAIAGNFIESVGSKPFQRIASDIDIPFKQRAKEVNQKTKALGEGTSDMNASMGVFLEGQRLESNLHNQGAMAKYQDINNQRGQQEQADAIHADKSMSINNRNIARTAGTHSKVLGIAAQETAKNYQDTLNFINAMAHESNIAGVKRADKKLIESAYDPKNIEINRNYNNLGTALEDAKEA